MKDSLKYKSLRGMPDILPEDAVLMLKIEETARKVFRLFGFKEFRPPILEETEVFTRSIGADTDIVSKEMYSFDRGDKNISLRPEGTAGVIRAYIEHEWNKTSDTVKLFYMGPMFRGERPQKGRLRQFYQIGAEIIGSKSPYVDAELIFCLNLILKGIGLSNFNIYLNSLGCEDDRSRYKKVLLNYFSGSSKEEMLCEDCKRRIKLNILRVLDCKREVCRTIIKDAPLVMDYLCNKCAGSYGVLKELLSDMSVPFKEKRDIVRGLDYYTGIVFEAVSVSLGAQDAVAAGGRYDNLTKDMGGHDNGATGFAVGVERLLLAIDKKGIDLGPAQVFIIPVDSNCYKAAFQFVNKFRLEGISCEMDYSGRSFKSQLRKANKDGKCFVIILGEEEKKNGKLLLKNMETGDQTLLEFEEAVNQIKVGI